MFASLQIVATQFQGYYSRLHAVVKVNRTPHVCDGYSYNCLLLLSQDCERLIQEPVGNIYIYIYIYIYSGKHSFVLKPINYL